MLVIYAQIHSHMTIEDGNRPRQDACARVPTV